MKNLHMTKTIPLLFLGLSFLLSSCTEALSGKQPVTKKEQVSFKSDDNKNAPNQKKKITSTKPPMRYRIADLPVPDNYRLDEEKSFIFETTNLKTGLLVYEGGSEMTDVIQFYREEMPKYGWNLIHLFQHKEANMLFDKDEWVCDITLRGSWSKNVLSLRIAPKDPGSAPPPNR